MAMYAAQAPLPRNLGNIDRDEPVCNPASNAAENREIA
jgi:hypothetical protein